MITYEVKKVSGQKPSLVKVITVSPSEKYETSLNVGMEKSEIDALSTSLIMEYCESLIQYIKDFVDTDLKVIKLTEKRGDYPFTAWGWDTIQNVKREYDEWWSYAFYNREPEE